MCKVITIALILCVTRIASSEIVYVNDDAAGSNDGTSWGNAFNDLQSALRAAQSGDEVWVAEGVYYPTQDTRRRVAFELQSGVGYLGGFSGTESSSGDRRWRRHQTILSGNIGDKAKRIDNSIHIVEAIGLDADTVLDGFVLTGAYNNHNEEEGRGGAVYMVNSEMLISHCLIKRNFAGGSGAMWIERSSPHIGYCVVRHNKQRAIACYAYTQATFEGCLFAKNWDYADGAAIASIAGSTVSVTRCMFLRNIVERDGGAYFGRDNAEFVDCVFIGNESGQHGGAIYQFDGPLTLSGCLLYANHGFGGGGGAIVGISGGTVTNCSLAGNISENRQGEEAQMTFSQPPVINYCLVEGWTGRWGGEGNFDADPKWIDAAGGNLRIGQDSPCVDAGTNDAVTEAVDLDGNPRILGGRVDIGAYENVCREVIDLAASMVEDDAEGHVGDGDGVCEGGEDCVVTATVAVDAATMPEGSTVRVAFTPVDENGEPDPDACCAEHTCGPDARCPKVRKARIDAAGQGTATMRGCGNGAWSVCIEGCGEALCREVECP